jgi:hypothetical protein
MLTMAARACACVRHQPRSSAAHPFSKRGGIPGLRLGERPATTQFFGLRSGPFADYSNAGMILSMAPEWPPRRPRGHAETVAPSIH